MNHLNEEELIDILMDEPYPAILKTHLAGCEVCREQMETLKLGLEATHIAEPKVPLMAVNRISFDGLKSKPLARRLGWLAVAAMLLLSFAGFRVEVGDSGFSMQFAMLGAPADTGSATDERIRVLEEKLTETIQLNAVLTQSQLDARFNAFYMERDEDLGEFSNLLDKKMKDLEILNAGYLSQVKDENRQESRNQNLRGTLQ